MGSQPYVSRAATRVHEPAGSGFVDLAVLERSLSDGGADAFPQEFASLRSRYGPRVPASIVKAITDRELAKIQETKRQILSQSDSEGKSISISSLRARLTKAYEGHSGLARQGLIAQTEQWLLELEVRYGAEIPLSAADHAELLFPVLLGNCGEPGRNRTFNQQIKSLLLCQLSYGPSVCDLLRRCGRCPVPSD